MARLSKDRDDATAWLLSDEECAPEEPGEFDGVRAKLPRQWAKVDMDILARLRRLPAACARRLRPRPGRAQRHGVRRRSRVTRAGPDEPEPEQPAHRGAGR
jgi:hypothetical protein